MDENLSLYCIFYTVARKKNISQAAKELFISQPAISKSISRLERSMNTTLFKRSSRGVTLTPEGKILYEYVEQAFLTIKTGEDTLARRQSLGISQLRIGVSSTLCKYVLLPYLQRFIKAYPHVRISIACQSTRQTLALLEENKIDIGLIGETDYSKSTVFCPLMKIQDIFVTTEDYLSHLRQRAEDGNLYQSATFMLLDGENITRQYVNQSFEKQGIQLSHVLEVSTMDLLIEFAKIGLGIACVIQEFVENDLKNGTLIHVPLSKEPEPRQIGFAFRKDEQKNAVIQNFLQI
ncbi:MAG: LysR family transcriptional regulator [Candidatus Choladocola sp.]|nr:LysR family transcriptional regulator [Candidatus Choladocola sp.]